MITAQEALYNMHKLLNYWAPADYCSVYVQYMFLAITLYAGPCGIIAWLYLENGLLKGFETRLYRCDEHEGKKWKQ